jgi:hypothetical protein
MVCGFAPGVGTFGRGGARQCARANSAVARSRLIGRRGGGYNVVMGRGNHA